MCAAYLCSHACLMPPLTVPACARSLAHHAQGNLKTHVIWDPQESRLRIALRQYVETPRKLEFKLKGNLDTISGAPQPQCCVCAERHGMHAVPFSDMHEHPDA